MCRHSQHSHHSHRRPAPHLVRGRRSLAQLERARDSGSRDQLVLAYAPMVRYIASRKVRELPAHCELDDLASSGLVALMEAIDRFDPAKGASFEQYAWTRVAGALVDELRKQDWASRSVRREGRRIERARDSFFARTGTMPTEAGACGELGTTVDEPAD